MKSTLVSFALLATATLTLAGTPTPPADQLTPSEPNTAFVSINLCITPQLPDPLPTLNLDFFEPGEACGCRLWWLVQVCTPMPESEAPGLPTLEQASGVGSRP